MKTKKSGLRQNAAVFLAALVLLGLGAVLINNSITNQAKYPATAEFLYGQFVDGKYLEGFTPGYPDYGFSLEALIQLSIHKQIDYGPAKEFLLEDGFEYLYAAEKADLQPGLAGKFLFASRVLGAANQENVEKILSELSKKVSQSGELGSGANSFDYSWLTLGLYAQDQKILASLVADQLTAFQREDGGFGFDLTENTVASSTDATAMAIQALSLTADVSSENGASKLELLDKAVAFLEMSMTDTGYFIAYDAEDVNGTALAFMALKAADSEMAESARLWLVSKLMEDGGIGSPWVEGAGDKYATAQGYLAIEGKNYLDLVGK